MKVPKFKTFVYQVVVDDKSLLVFEDTREANEYLQDFTKGIAVNSAIILPIAVFSFEEVKVCDTH